MDIRIRKILEQDIESVYLIERQVYPRPWSLESFEFEITVNPVARAFLAESQNLVVGYLVGWVIENEYHIGNVATHPDLRRQGIAQQLIQYGIDSALREECRTAFLEVRSRNKAAICLYRKFGFIQYNLRKNYYEDDDAVMLKKEMFPILEKI